MEIAERCEFDLPIGKSQMPTVPLPAGVTVAQHLRNKATEGAKHLYGEIVHWHTAIQLLSISQIFKRDAFYPVLNTVVRQAVIPNGAAILRIMKVFQT